MYTQCQRSDCQYAFSFVRKPWCILYTTVTYLRNVSHRLQSFRLHIFLRETSADVFFSSLRSVSFRYHKYFMVLAVKCFSTCRNIARVIHFCFRIIDHGTKKFSRLIFTYTITYYIGCILYSNKSNLTTLRWCIARQRYALEDSTRIHYVPPYCENYGERFISFFLLAISQKTVNTNTVTRRV